MWSIKRWLTIALLAAVLSACASLPTPSFKARPSEEKPVENTEDLSAESEQALAALPNPYLQNPPIVPTSLAELFNAALAKQQSQQWQQAEQLWLELTSTYPSFSGPWLNLGLVQQQLGQQALAMSSYRQAITVNPNNLDAYNQLAVAMREQGEFAEAESLYKEALTRWPDHATSHRNLGILYDLYLHQPSQALFHYKQVQRLLVDADEAQQRQLKGWILEVERRQKAEYANAPNP